MSKITKTTDMPIFTGSSNNKQHNKYQDLVNEAIHGVSHKYKDYVKEETVHVIRSYTGLRPYRAPFAMQNGKTKYFLCIKGKVPIMKEGVMAFTLHIRMYIHKRHPLSPPEVFIRPSRNMDIKAGQNVDSEGRVYLPYLSSWIYPKSDLIGLLDFMVLTFSQLSPVTLRRRSPSASPTPQRKALSNPPSRSGSSSRSRPNSRPASPALGRRGRPSPSRPSDGAGDGDDDAVDGFMPNLGDRFFRTKSAGSSSGSSDDEEEKVCEQLVDENGVHRRISVKKYNPRVGRMEYLTVQYGSMAVGTDRDKV
ncbi:tumor susceptibility gene 101 protein-like [Branchiostoma floridae]|uniref:Tumor susceptibility gene 101 protein-like n=3 Tax=Branchiostoma floridae TaxID=7739 RepID=A0A9J7KK24_BRAFL|nr:tumor susceptibility gene 101 protein-like [Branchiostoma floridae]